MNKLLLPYILFLIVLQAGCRSQKEEWVNNFTDAFEQNSISDEIDWTMFKNAISMAYDTSKYLAIERGLTLYGNKHTMYRINGQNIFGDYRIDYNVDYCNFNNQFVKGNKPSDIGYIVVKSLGIYPELPNKEKQLKATKYINEIQQQIESQTGQNKKGWIIDLRFNGGGNMWPMLIALRPFLNQGTLGYFINNNKTVEWKVDEEDIKQGNYSMNKSFLSNKYKFEYIDKDLPIAVLIGNKTSSSGEAISIALESLSNMKYFGDSTSGFSTANKTIPIAKNEYLIITSAVMVNYNKEEIPDGIKIDTKICDEEKLLKSITKWMNDGK